MRGQIITFDPLKGSGLISGDDGNRYNFEGSSWRGNAGMPRAGLKVDFEPAGTVAEDVFPLAGTSPAADVFGPGHKSPIVAGLLALFLGQFGIHKFYLGYNSQGVLLLAGFFVSLVLSFIIIGLIPLMIIGVVCLIEAIIYLTKSEADFNATYVEGHKPWF